MWQGNYQNQQGHANWNQQFQQQQQFNQNAGFYNQGGNQGNQQQFNDPRKQKDNQIQEVKKAYSNVVHESHTNIPVPIDVIELTLPIKDMQIPLSLLLDESYPITHPRILIRGRMKHKMFEDGPNGIEIQVSSFMQWDTKFSLLYTLQNLKNFFERDPPTQEKIISEVNDLLLAVAEQDFKNLVTTDINTYFKSKSVQELKDYVQAPSYQEIIASSKEYQKIAKNLVDVVSFNERVAGEIMQKTEAINKRKQKAAELAQKIDQLKKEFVHNQSQCRSVSDRFSLQEVGRAVESELMTLERISNDLDESASYGKGASSVEDLIQVFFETRKKYHHFNIIREKLPSISPN